MILLYKLDGSLQISCELTDVGGIVIAVHSVPHEIIGGIVQNDHHIQIVEVQLFQSVQRLLSVGGNLILQNLLRPLKGDAVDSGGAPDSQPVGSIGIHGSVIHIELCVFGSHVASGDRAVVDIGTGHLPDDIGKAVLGIPVVGKGSIAQKQNV